VQIRELNTGGNMELRVAARLIVVGFFSCLMSLSTLAQGLPPGVTPGMLKQLKSMSPAQQEALARQYGISLPDMEQGAGVSSRLSEPGEPLSPPGDQQYLGEFPLMPEAVEAEEDERVRFGMSLFDSEVSTFAPTDNAPVPDSYRLGVGDELVVQLYGKENEQLFLQVDRTGVVSFPKLGAITL